MKTPVNRFKKAISEKQAQIGLWLLVEEIRNVFANSVHIEF